MFQVIYIIFLFIFGFNVCFCFEEAWQAYHDSFRNANREELVITNVTSDENFKLNATVKKWSSLSIGPTCYSIGILETGLAVLFSNLNSNNSLFNIKSEIKELKGKPVDAFLLQNRSLQIIEAILVVSFQDDFKLEWYKIHETKLELFWTWNLIQSITHINAFSLNNKRILLLGTGDVQNTPRVDLYQYELKNDHKYWFWHSLDISNTITSSAFSNFEFDTYLSLPQKYLNMVSVFRHEDNRFVPYKTILSKNVDTVVAFEIGFQSFLAIDGSNAGIFQFTRNGLDKEHIANSNLDDIEFWMPVPVETYRDEVIVLAQRNLNHASHSAYVIEIFTYNGGKFEEYEDILCNHFGEEIELLTCLSEKSGIIGSSYIAVRDKIALIVPRGPTSILFNMNFKIKEVSNPLELELKELLNEKKRLQDMIDTEINYYEEPSNISETFEVLDGEPHENLLSRQSEIDSVSTGQQLEDIGNEIEDVKVKVDRLLEMENRTEFDELTINGVVEIEGEGKFKEIVVETLNGEPATDLLKDIVRKDSMGHIPGSKIIKKLEVRHIIFDKVNGVEASDIVFGNDSVVRIEDNVVIHGNAEVENVELISGRINDLDFINEVVDMRNEYHDLLNFENVRVRNGFHVDIINDKSIQSDQDNVLSANDTELNEIVLQNLTVTNINGDDFDIFCKQLCLVNIKCYIPGDLKINGNVTTEKLSTYYLNNLKFPEEYIFRKSDGSPTVVTGRKTFKNFLVAKEIKTRGKIDAIDTKKLITLSTDQPEILGTITFKDIEVVEQLNVTGKILGEHIDKFLPNPTLQFVKNISANVNFKNLEVDGNIIIENNFNHDNLESLLEDLIYKDEEETEVAAPKEFPHGFSVKGDLRIASNSINNISMDTIVTKNTDQDLYINLLNGNVVVDNAEVEGKFNGENITKIDQELVKLNGEQQISSTLTFAEDLKAKNLEITETLNNVTLEEYLSTENNEEVDTELRYKDIKAENVTIEGNFMGNIVGFDIKEFNEKYLSYSKDQTINEHYDIVHSTIDNIKVERINNEDYEDYFSYEKFAINIFKMMDSGHATIRDIYVKGPLHIKSINEKNESYWLPKDDLKDFNGNYKKNLTIEGNIIFKALNIDRLSSVNWTWFNQQLIRKDEVNVVIEAPYKNFLGGIKVAKLIETKKINGIPIENLLTKQGEQILSGPITIKGNVVVKDSINILENLNEVAIGEILDSLELENGTITIKGDIIFSRVPHIYDLDIEGQLNNKNITAHLSDVVQLDEDPVLFGEFLFEEPVTIGGNLAVEQNINDVDLEKLGDQIVLTTKDAQIQGPVTFTLPVVIKKHLAVDGDLNTAALYGIDVEEWKNNSVYVDQGLIEGTYEIDTIVIENALTIKTLNGMDIDSIIPLRSNQTIDHLEFGDVTATRNISVGGMVNGYSNLYEEFENTLMIDGDQKVDSNIIFNNVILIRENLSTDFINGVEVSKIVTTDTDQNLTSTFNFKAQCKIDSDLNVQGLVNGINTTIWKNKNVKVFSPKIQHIHDDWNVTVNVSFMDNIGGKSLINDLNLTKVMEEVVKRKNYKCTVEHGIIEDYKHMCTDVSYIREALKKQIYKFKYFEDLQTIIFSNQIQHVHYFQFKGDHYLLVNNDNCSSQILVFQNTNFEYLYTVVTGHISQIAVVQGNDSLYLVSRAAELKRKCGVGGTNVWRFNEDTLELFYNMEDQELLQESAVPFTFYGLSKGSVVEYQVTFSLPRKYRSWNVEEDNVAFLPRGLKTGLSLRTGSKVIVLDRSDPLVEEDSGATESVIKGNRTEVMNHYVPGLSGGDLVVTKVGIKSARKNLLAVATHEETSVKGRLDFVKIYSDAVKGEIFHKVPAYRPSYLLSIEFDQGETLLAFLENRKTLQIYEYKGIEGFQHRTSARVEGSKLFLMTLPVKLFLNPRKAIGIVHKNKIRIIHSIMAGNRIRDDLKCGL